MFLFDIVQVLFQPSSEVLKDNTEYYRIPNFKIISSKKITTKKMLEKLQFGTKITLKSIFCQFHFKFGVIKLKTIDTGIMVFIDKVVE